MKGVTFADDIFEEVENTTDVNTAADGLFNPSSNARGGKRLRCPNCGSCEIELHEASGASICTECGVVVEENALVSSVEFVEGAGGSSSMIGQFVSASSSKAYGSGGGRNGRYGFSRDSRETTLANGRRRIQDVASRMRLGHHFIDAAHRLFTIAVERNFCQGRRTLHVVATCLYIACRQERSQHMLIDFSDALEVNVYVLGNCFLKFRRLLGLKLEIIDPALYVYRFAAHLDLDEKANAVALTALRIVGRMKRDWIVAGRRPAGICAAALLIAARAHGFSRGTEDVTKILRVCGMTVTHRVREFELTPSATLTLDQFNTVDIQEEADPPVYSRNKLLEARAQAIRENNMELLASGALDDPQEGKKASRWREEPKFTTKEKQLSDLYMTLEAELTGGATDVGQGEDLQNNLLTDGAAGTENQLVVHQSTGTETDATTTKSLLPSIRYPKKNGSALMLLPTDATEEELQRSTQPTEEKFSLTAWKEKLPENAMEEIELLFRNDNEVTEKEVIFDSINKEYLDQQKRKKDMKSDSETKEVEEEDVSQRHKKKKFSVGRSGKEGDGIFPTTEQALLAAVSTRKVSRKINYDAMSSIFDDDGSFSTDLLRDKTVQMSSDVDWDHL